MGDDQVSEPRTSRRHVRISDVAQAAGVSKALVSYALNDRQGVKESTRAHIVAVARSMGWTPSLRARSLSVSRAYAIGLVFHRSPDSLASDEYMTSLMAGLHSVLSQSRYALVTEVVADEQAEVEAYATLARDGRVDGMVLVDPKADDPRMAVMAEHGVAHVVLGRPSGPTTMPVMVYDQSLAIVEVVDHLVLLGHRRIAQVTGPQVLGSARLRRSLYQARLREHGLGDGWWVESDYTPSGGRSATEQILADDDPPTAIIYSNDMMALAGMGVALGRGLRVPDDLSVVGYDGIAVAQYLHPTLSTIGQHPYDDGREAAALLLEAIDGRTFDEPVHTTNPVFLPRESTGPAPR